MQRHLEFQNKQSKLSSDDVKSVTVINLLPLRGLIHIPVFGMVFSF